MKRRAAAKVEEQPRRELESLVERERARLAADLAKKSDRKERIKGALRRLHPMD